MPEAAVDENRSLHRSDHNVRFTREVPIVERKPNTQAGQEPAYEALGSGVPAMDLGHDPTPKLRRQVVHLPRLGLRRRSPTGAKGSGSLAAAELLEVTLPAAALQSLVAGLAYRPLIESAIANSARDVRHDAARSVQLFLAKIHLYLSLCRVGLVQVSNQALFRVVLQLVLCSEAVECHLQSHFVGIEPRTGVGFHVTRLEVDECDPRRVIQSDYVDCP